jgi:hypothetical protein
LTAWTELFLSDGGAAGNWQLLWSLRTATIADGIQRKGAKAQSRQDILGLF